MRKRDSVFTPTTELVLERLKFQLAEHVSKGVLENWSVRPAVMENMILDGMIIRLEAEVLAYGGTTELVSVPADWWQHFKQRWFPRFLLRRWPVVLRKYEYRKFEKMCPHTKRPHTEFFLADKLPSLPSEEKS